ncbi:hypothetical protein [Sinimarinibacterium flocculans]|uniref:Uncharacterized protein n=1 Tax=Sinimarinibacterium flocculans TaxID=985250 RepID=A0A318E4D5_9GAMM|nr:hypothetical protein [Sinimarinibacterium flocculans]MEC9362396.1 hypothetical protein [Pseudomonadota bacterium]PXV66085.1 hypothetical protein C8D93_10857 [Sinimarinibacterium flocculans]
MIRDRIRNVGITGWLRWLGNWGLALAGLGCLPAEPASGLATGAERIG